MMKIVIDTGFGRTKALTAGKAISFPSLVANYREVRFTTGMECNGNSTSKLVLEYNGKHYFMGSTAERQSIAQNTIDHE